MKSHLRIDATSIMRGMSREKPSLVLDRCMELIWSAYEVIGDRTRLEEGQWEIERLRRADMLTIVAQSNRQGVRESET